MTGPGSLNRRLTLEAPVETADGAGGVARDYQVVAALWAEVTAVAARAEVIAAARGATVTHRIRVRRNPFITTRHRLRDGARLFLILAMRERAGGRFLDIQAEERRD